jgi:hypothetical protein
MRGKSILGWTFVKQRGDGFNGKVKSVLETKASTI